MTPLWGPAAAFVLGALLTSHTAFAANPDILGDGFTFRRPLNFKPAACDAPGVNLAVAEFYTNGLAKPDGADIRVTNAQRVIMPHRLMQVSKENDFVRIAFATPGEGPYYVWWGNAKIQAPEKPLEIERGIYTEIFKTPGVEKRDVRTPDGLEKLFERAKPAVGAVFVPEIFLAYNPLGEEWDTMFHYSAQFKIDKPITADFAFTVANSGTLSIDGKPLAKELRGGIKNHVRDPIPLDLTLGWHKIEVTQANLDGGQTGVVVAWKKPGDKNYAPLPAAIFAPVAQATAGPLEQVGTASSYAADFTVAPEAEAFSPPESYLQRYAFEAEFPANYRPKLTWDYGDGQTAGDLKRVTHIYLVPGVYTVTLRVEQTGNVFTATRRITIKDRMYSRFPRPPEDNAKTVTAVLKDDDLHKLTGDQAFKGMSYFKDKGEPDLLLAWGKAWAQSKDAARGTSTFDEVFDLARLLELHNKYADAAEIFKTAAAKNIPMEQRVQLMRYYVMTACDYADDATPALKEAQNWRKNINDTSREQLRTVQAATLYAAIAGNDAKLAKATIDEINAKDDTLGKAYTDRQIRQGVLARNIENYIRTKDFDTALKLIDEWDLEFPDAIWEGFTRTLRIKVANAENRPAVAARMAMALAKANPSGFYAAELLFRASEAYKAAGDNTQAKAALDLLNAKYPESPYARGEGKDK